VVLPGVVGDVAWDGAAWGEAAGDPLPGAWGVAGDCAILTALINSTIATADVLFIEALRIAEITTFGCLFCVGRCWFIVNLGKAKCMKRIVKLGILSQPEVQALRALKGAWRRALAAA
jgi:hypothetical protein